MRSGWMRGHRVWTGMLCGLQGLQKHQSRCLRPRRGAKIRGWGEISDRAASDRIQTKLGVGRQRVILFWVYLCVHESVCKYVCAVPMEARGEC